MRSRVPKVVVVALVPAVLALYMVSRSPLQDGALPPGPFLDELRECFYSVPPPPIPEADAVRQVMSFCASGIIYRAAFDFGPSAATLLMRDLMRLEPRFDDCHVAAHEIAHAVALTGDERRLMDAGLLGECDWGYYDGAVMALAEMNPEDSDAELAARAQAFCDLFPRDDPFRAEVVANCFHGLGHVFWDRHFPDAPAAFAACALLEVPAESERLYSGAAQCAGGAAMSLSEHMLYGGDASLGLEHPSMVCPPLPEEMHSQCLQYTAYDDMLHRGGDPSGFLGWCLEVEGLGSLARSECAPHVGTFVGRSGRLELLDVCSGLQDGLSRGCLARALQVYVFYRGSEGFDRFCSERADICASEVELVAEARSGALFPLP